MYFTANTKMADIIHENYLLLPILNRFDIHLGFGDKNVREICRDQEVNIDFFLVIINSFHDHNFFPEEHLKSFPIALILDYIKKSHSYYLNYKVPQIEGLINKLVASAESHQRKHFELIAKFFDQYKEELITHIQDEDNRIFPYVSTIDKLYTSENTNDAHRKLIRENTISKFASEHSNIEDKLFDLKNIMIKYMPPVKDYSLYNALLIEIFRLERDLNDHARIEDNVMVPKVQLIEEEILSRD
jgi:regulator of cell morphogenesis and NO signaling